MRAYAHNPKRSLLMQRSLVGECNPLMCLARKVGTLGIFVEAAEGGDGNQRRALAPKDGYQGHTQEKVEEREGFFFRLV